MEVENIKTNMKFFIIILNLSISLILSSSQKVYFINLKDGDMTTSPVFVQFGLSGKGVAPAGINMPNTGHHHLLINVDEIDLSKPIPSSDKHIHFGGGQTEAFINLPAGEHSLQLLLGDMAHRPHATPVISEKIKITVTK
mgnify:FL=1